MAIVTAPLLKLESVSRTFGGLAAVSNVSLEVMPGQIFSIIGPNGAGQTTLVNMISGVLRTSSGRITMEGRDLDGVRPCDFVALGIGRTFQNLALFKHGTVVDNMLVGRHRHMKTTVLESILH
jgi:branched-chain amino acid transport system ATP-binding protein